MNQNVVLTGFFDCCSASTAAAFLVSLIACRECPFSGTAVLELELASGRNGAVICGV